MPSFVSGYTYNNQYRVVTTKETTADDPLSLRSVKTIADNINNYKRHVGHHKVISVAYPLGLIQSTLGSTDENIVLSPFAPVYVPNGYNKLRMWVGGIRTAGAGTTTFKLYFGADLYRGPTIFDQSYIQKESYMSVVVNADTHDIYLNTSNLSGGSSMTEHYDYSRMIWCVLTATNSNDTTQSDLITLDVQPVIE